MRNVSLFARVSPSATLIFRVLRAVCDCAHGVEPLNIKRQPLRMFRFGIFADGGKLALNWGHWHRRRSGCLSFQKPCSIPSGPIPQLAATDLLIAGAAEPPAVGVHPG